MKEIAFLLLGWLLGLLSPFIVDAARSRRFRRDLAKAIRTEAEDLQYRVALASFLLAKRCGAVSREYLVWLKPKLQAYTGNEPVDSVRELVEKLISTPDDQLDAIRAQLGADSEIGLSLKTFTASLIDSAAPQMVHFPAEYQRRIHEFKNHLSYMNQEIERAKSSLDKTYDSSISGENHKRLKSDLESKYNFIKGMCERVADRLQEIIDFDLKAI